MDEVENLCKEMNDLDGKAIDILDSFELHNLQITWRMVTSQKLGHDHPKLRSLLEGLHSLFKEGMSLLNHLAMNYPSFYFICNKEHQVNW